MINPQQAYRQDLIDILGAVGKRICDARTQYFEYILTVTSSEGILLDFTLYFQAPEIKYEYRVINVTVSNVSQLKIRFFTLATNQCELYDVDISNGTQQYISKLNEIVNLGLFKMALESLVNQIELRRQYKNRPLTNKIIPGQARVAILTNGDRINAGWIRIEGDKVVYYTGKGLREIWKPNMNQQEQALANRLKQKSEEELINEGYIDKKSLVEFIDIL